MASFADNAVDRVETPATVTTKGGVEMVLIPGGTFEMGSKRGKEDAGAVHTVSVDARWTGAGPITTTVNTPGSKRKERSATATATIVFDGDTLVDGAANF